MKLYASCSACPASLTCRSEPLRWSYGCHRCGSKWLATRYKSGGPKKATIFRQAHRCGDKGLTWNNKRECPVCLRRTGNSNKAFHYSTVTDTRAYHPKRNTAEFAPGSFYARTDVPNLLIFGEIIESTYAEDRRLMKESPHIRLVRAYSVACSEGEMGNEHVPAMIAIPEGVFEFAKSKEWVVTEGDFFVFKKVYGTGYKYMKRPE